MTRCRLCRGLAEEVVGVALGHLLMQRKADGSKGRDGSAACPPGFTSTVRRVRRVEAPPVSLKRICFVVTCDRERKNEGEMIHGSMEMIIKNIKVDGRMMKLALSP